MSTPKEIAEKWLRQSGLMVGDYNRTLPLIEFAIIEALEANEQELATAKKDAGKQCAIKEAEKLILLKEIEDHTRTKSKVKELEQLLTSTQEWKNQLQSKADNSELQLSDFKEKVKIIVNATTLGLRELKSMVSFAHSKSYICPQERETINQMEEALSLAHELGLEDNK